jgi:ABC-type multidrug transport system ATPase subunit
LRKNISDIESKKVVANNISLNIYSGQIIVLLGHDGTEKTTTMDMITGIFPPTPGSVFVNGYNIVIETDNVRRSIRLCPQV